MPTTISGEPWDTDGKVGIRAAMRLHIIALRGAQRQGQTSQQVDNVLPTAASHSYGGGRMERVRSWTGGRKTLDPSSHAGGVKVS